MRISAACTMLVVLSLLSLATAQEKKIKRTQLPPNVERAVAALAETATIRGFSQEIEHGVTYYEAELTVADHHKDVLMDTNGNVVEVEEEVALASLPPSVQDGLQARARGGKVENVESIIKHGKLAAYEAHLIKNGKRSEVQVGPEGEPLNHEE